MANPIVTFEMENGDIMKAELYPEIAPNTVRNFVSLVNKGYYDGLIFHRVIRGFMIQGGMSGTEPERVARDTTSKGNFHRMVLRMTLHMIRACFPWRVQCIRIPQVPSSLSCMRNLRIWTELTPHSERSQRAWISSTRSQRRRPITATDRWRRRL